MIARLDNASSLLLNNFQHRFPLEQRPFAAVARAAHVDEAGALLRYRRMTADGLISRIGPVVAPNAVRASTLAAMAVPPADIGRVAALVSSEAGVNHNYEREHAINLWFVVSAADEAGLVQTLQRIESKCGLPVRDLRLEEPYHLDLGFSLSDGGANRRRLKTPDLEALQPEDEALLAALEDGIPLITRPYRHVGVTTDLGEDRVLSRLGALKEAHVIRRFGVVVRHRTLGMRANAMAVWNMPDEHVRAIGKRFAGEEGVTLCYRRRRAGDWPYNLYCMVHGSERPVTLAVIDRLNRIAADKADGHAVLFSTRCFKQTGARFTAVGNAA